jgi:hemolysin III
VIVPPDAAPREVVDCKPESRTQTSNEEIANAVTHGIGAALGTAALVALVVIAGARGDAWRVVSLSVYGSSLVFMYLCSTLYHSFRQPRLKRYFCLMDHLSIYLLIAGTYTPITLVPMRGPWGWTLFGLIWGMAACGILSKLLLFGRLRFLSLAFYLAMGWLVVIAVRPMLQMLPTGLLVWIGAGGFFYTLGVVFFCLTRLRYHHTIWHLFVLAGSLCHFIGILLYVAVS